MDKENKPKPKIKKRIRYRHRMANPKTGYQKKYADKYDSVDWGNNDKPEPTITTKLTHGSQYVDVGNDSH